MVGGTVAKTAQQGARSAQESINKLVEGPNHHEYRQVPIDESKKGFWDDFSSIADQREESSSAIGTSAMGKGGGGGVNRANKPAEDWEEW